MALMAKSIAAVLGGLLVLGLAACGDGGGSATAARAGLRSGMFRAVRAEGWCRPPDGCNYAIFTGTDADEPGAVVRLPLRREVSSTEVPDRAGIGHLISLRPQSHGAPPSRCR